MATETLSQHKPKVTISKELAAQIGFLHNQCPLNKEWSGLLIYQVTKGSIEDLENLEIKAHAVFPMDFGDATFTSFEASNSWLTAFSTFPQVDPLTPTPGWYLGKIHSHHNMPVFHSGTDKNDLHETAPKLPMFLSLIVNYNTQTDCELAIEIEAEERIITEIHWKLKGWKEKISESKTDTPTAKRVYVLKCNVNYEQDEWFVKEIEALKEKNKPKSYTGYAPSVTIHDYRNNSKYGSTTYGKEEEAYKNKYIGQGTSKKQRGKKNKKNQVIHSADIQAALSGGNIPEYSYKTYQTVLKEIADLFTLGLGHTFTPYDALKKVDIDLSAALSDQYQKAFIYYFMQHWYPVNFAYNPSYIDADEIEVIRAIQNFVSYHKTLWIETIVTKALRSLEVMLENLVDDGEEEDDGEATSKLNDALEEQQMALYNH